MLTARQRSILTFLAGQENYVTGAILADVHDVSERTIRTDILCIRQEIKKFGGEIDSRPKAGFKLTLPAGKTIVDFWNSQEMPLLPQVRTNAILLLLAMEKRTTTEQLEEKLLVSRNTVVADMKVVAVKADVAGLQLDAKGYKGTMLLGEEVTLRNFIFAVQGELRQLNPSLLAEFMQEKAGEFFDVSALLIAYAENIIGTKFADSAVRELKDILPFCLLRCRLGYHAPPSGHKNDENFIKICASVYGFFADNGQGFVTEGDADYIAVLFTGSPKLGGAGSRDDALTEVCLEFIKDYAKEVNIAVDFDDTVTKQFILHLQVAIFRLQHKLPIENTLQDEIKYASSFIYDIARKLCRKYEIRWQVSVPESELAFITVYLETLLSQYAQDTKPLKIVIVCHGGMATSTLLKQRLSICMPTLAIEKICRYEDLDDELPVLRPDLILTTLGTNIAGYPCVQVNPVLPATDINKISTALSRIAYQKRNEGLIGGIDSGGFCVMEELIPEEFCQFAVQVTDWKNAVSRASLPLERAGKITAAYAADMIEVVKTMGNYMIFFPEIAFVHAKTDHVKENGMAALFLPNVIDFGTKTVSPVKVIVVVANKEENFVLTKLIRLLMQGDNIRLFKEAASYDDLRKLGTTKEKKDATH